MTKTVKNALKSMLVLVCVSVVCVTILAICNMFFPKYVPTLDVDTAKKINAICDTGVSDEIAFEEKYIVMLDESSYGVTLDDYNKTNKSQKAEILAVYGEPKGKNAFSYIIESKSEGRDGDVIVLIAYNDGQIIGAAVKKQGESYYHKLPENLFSSLVGMSGKVDLNGTFGKTGATLTLNAIERAVNLANGFAIDYSSSIRSAIAQINTSVDGEGVV